MQVLALAKASVTSSTVEGLAVDLVQSSQRGGSGVKEGPEKPLIRIAKLKRGTHPCKLRCCSGAVELDRGCATPKQSWQWAACPQTESCHSDFLRTAAQSFRCDTSHITALDTISPFH